MDDANETAGRDDVPPGGRDAMPRWVPRAIVLAVLGLAALDVAGWLLGRLKGVLVMILASLFLSFAIEPAVNALARRGWRRGAATGVVFLGLLAVGLAFVAAMTSLVANQVADFVDEAPRYFDDLERFVNERFDAEISFDEIVSDLTSEDGPLRNWAERAASSALDLTGQVLGALFQVFTVALFTFYLVADGPKLRRTICSRLRPDRQRTVLHTWELAIEKTGGYIYSRSLLALISAFFHWAALTAIGVPYAVPLALWAGIVSQFVPVIGTYIGGALPIAIALLHDPFEGLWVLAFVVAYQQVENYLFAPRVTKATMELHPAVAFGTVIVGAGLLGPIGAVLALPAAAVVQAVGSTYLQEHEVVESALVAETPPRGRRRRRRGGAAPGA